MFAAGRPPGRPRALADGEEADVIMGGLFSKGLSKDLLAGLIFVGFGLAFGYASLKYDVWHALSKCPGYFPVVL